MIDDSMAMARRWSSPLVYTIPLQANDSNEKQRSSKGPTTGDDDDDDRMDVEYQQDHSVEVWIDMFLSCRLDGIGVVLTVSLSLLADDRISLSLLADDRLNPTINRSYTTGYSCSCTVVVSDLIVR